MVLHADAQLDVASMTLMSLNHQIKNNAEKDKDFNTTFDTSQLECSDDDDDDSEGEFEISGD